MILINRDFQKEQVISHRLYGMDQKNWEWVTARDQRTYSNLTTYRTIVKTIEGPLPRVSPLIPGIAVADDGKVYIVARYSSPGNIIGQYEENVLALSSINPVGLEILLIFLNLILIL